FHPYDKLSEGPFYNMTVNPNDEVHVLVCVIPADTTDLMRDEVITKVREIRKAATKL
ncbi:interferon-induced protein 44-like, partial [Scomber scombrus]